MNEQDPIVEEVRRAGEAYFAEFNFDLDAIREDLNRSSEQEGRNAISLPSRPARPNAPGTKKAG